MSANQQLADLELIRTIQLQRVATGILHDLLARLKTLERQMAAAVLAHDPGAGRTARTRHEHERELYAEIEERIRAVYDELRKRLEEDFDDIAERQKKDEQEWLAAIFGATFTGDTEPQAGAGTLISGAAVAAWLRKQQNELLFRSRALITQGLAAGDDAEVIARRLRGRSVGGGAPEEPGVTSRSAAALEATVRTGIGAVIQDVATENAVQSRGIRYGWQQISVLDARTTVICRAYAYKRWNREYEPIGHRLPFAGGVPRHVNCRSRIVMILLDDEPLAEVSFRQWLARIPAAQQQRIFGAERLRLWREGKLSDADLLRQQERALGLDDLND